MEKKLIGKVSHWFNKISVAVVDLTDELKVGDKIIIEGAAGTVEQTVESMQVEHKNVETAKAGDSIGLKVNGKVRNGYKVFKVVE